MYHCLVIKCQGIGLKMFWLIFFPWRLAINIFWLILASWLPLRTFHPWGPVRGFNLFRWKTWLECNCCVLAFPFDGVVDINFQKCQTEHLRGNSAPRFCIKPPCFFVSHYAMSRSKASWLPNPSKLLFCWVLCNAICMQPNRFWSCESSLLCWRHLEMLQRLGVSCDALARIHLGGKWPTVSPVQRGLQLRPRRRSGRKISYNSTISWWTKVIKKLETKTIIMATMTKMTPGRCRCASPGIAT